MLAWSFTKARQSVHCYHLNSWLFYIQWNFINLASMETDGCQIIKYSTFSNSTYTDQSSYRQFLGTFAKLRKLILSYVFSVSLRGPALFPLDIFSWNLIFHCFSKSVKEVQVALQSGKNNGCFTWRLIYICVCVHACAWARACMRHCGDFLLLVTIAQIL